MAERMKILQKGREKHEFRNVGTQNGKIMFWDSVSDRVTFYYNFNFLSLTTQQCLIQKMKISFDFRFILFYFILSFSVLEDEIGYFLFLFHSTGNAPLIKSIFVKILFILLNPILLIFY